MRFRLTILAFAVSLAAPAVAYAADAPERRSSYEDDVYVATRERGNYVYEEEPVEEQVVVRRRFVEVVEPPIYERRIRVRHARRAYDPYYGRSYRRYDEPRRRGRWSHEVIGGW